MSQLETTRRGVIAGAAALAIGALSPAAAQAQSWDEVVAAAKKEGKLTLYHNIRPAGIEVILQKFRAVYPTIQTEQVRLGSGPLNERFRTEFVANRHIADLLITYADDDVLKEIPNWFAQWNPPEFQGNFPAAAKIAEGRMYAITQVRESIVWNKTLVKDADAPKEWADLLDPKWKGKVAFTDPANSGSAYTTVTMLVDLWGGGETGWKKVAALFKNLKVLNRSSLVFQGVGNGEYPLGISLEYAGPMWAAGGAPVKTIYPADGTLATMEGVAIVKNGPNPDSARAFVDYINRKDTREMILKATFRRPTRGDLDLATLPGNMPALSSLKILSYDEDAWTDKRKETLERIKDTIQESR